MRSREDELFGYNFERNLQKAIAGLKGILSGVVADNTLTAAELLYLDCWARNQRALAKDGDYIDLVDAIDDVLSDGQVTSDELADIKQLIEDISHYKYRYYYEPDWEAGINALLGYTLGLAADRTLNDLEIHSLRQWLENNSHLSHHYPANILTQRLDSILADGKISEDERSDLLEVLTALSGDQFEGTGLAAGLSNFFVGEDIESIDYQGKILCPTGKFVVGPRTTVKRLCESAGATVIKNVTNQLDVLLVGPCPSPNWRFTSFGRKIEKALELKSRGFQISIITEDTWIKHISQ